MKFLGPIIGALGATGGYLFTGSLFALVFAVAIWAALVWEWAR